MILLALNQLTDSEDPLESLSLQRVIKLQEGLKCGKIVLNIVIVGPIDSLDKYLGDFLAEFGVLLAHVCEALPELLPTRLVAEEYLEQLSVKEHLLLQIA